MIPILVHVNYENLASISFPKRFPYAPYLSQISHPTAAYFIPRFQPKFYTLTSYDVALVVLQYAPS